ncbi:hypothetical protein D3C77_539210 [compost metagenome]
MPLVFNNVRNKKVFDAILTTVGMTWVTLEEDANVENVWVYSVRKTAKVMLLVKAYSVVSTICTLIKKLVKMHVRVNMARVMLLKRENVSQSVMLSKMLVCLKRVLH